MTQSLTRRRLLAATGGSIALAGCLGDADDDDGSEIDQEAAMGDWQEVPLEDVMTGEEFTIAEIDRPVVIHTFATYCPTCNSHQDGVSDGYGDVDDEIAFVDLSVDQNDDPADVREHAEDNGHEWRFGVAPSEVTSDLIDAFGQSVTTPSQSPLMSICPDRSAPAALNKPATVEEIQTAVETGCE